MKRVYRDDCEDDDGHARVWPAELLEALDEAVPSAPTDVLRLAAEFAAPRCRNANREGHHDPVTVSAPSCESGHPICDACYAKDSLRCDGVYRFSFMFADECSARVCDECKDDFEHKCVYCSDDIVACKDCEYKYAYTCCGATRWICAPCKVWESTSPTTEPVCPDCQEHLFASIRVVRRVG